MNLGQAPSAPSPNFRTVLREKGTKVPFWKAVAKGLNRPTRKAYRVNVNKIEKFAKPKEAVLVPGFVLGSGEIKKPHKVVALKFSASAKQKIESKGGKCVLIEDDVSENPKGLKTSIMG